MGDYQDLVKQEAKAFYEANHPTFLTDSGEFGGQSPSPNFPRWIDRTGKLSARVTEICSKWGPDKIHWVQANTRNKSTQGGDPKGNAFGSFLMDVRQEIKKIGKGPHKG
jgi:hypothetical protein